MQSQQFYLNTVERELSCAVSKTSRSHIEATDARHCMLPIGIWMISLTKLTTVESSASCYICMGKTNMSLRPENHHLYRSHHNPGVQAYDMAGKNSPVSVQLIHFSVSYSDAPIQYLSIAANRKKCQAWPLTLYLIETVSARMAVWTYNNFLTTNF